MSSISTSTHSELRAWIVPIALFAATLVSTSYVGASMNQVDVSEAFSQGVGEGLRALGRGADFALPLMSILLAHELGHYFVGRAHAVRVSPPHFLPLPFALLGTLGAVIRLSRVPTKNALLDVGAAGPIAGLVVALPVLAYGIATSPIRPAAPGGEYILEGHSLLYEGLLFALHGPIPPGHDIFLTGTAFAGWAGLTVTMINLVPFGTLDGGHIAYAWLGDDIERLERVALVALPSLSVILMLWFGGHAWLAGGPWESVRDEALGGVHWLAWVLVLLLVERLRPPADPQKPEESEPPSGELSPGRRLVAQGMLVMFALLFMPWWVRPS